MKQQNCADKSIDVDVFFRLLDANNLPFCVVGDADKIPEEIESDLDVVINTAPHIVWQYVADFCRTQRLEIVQHLQHEITAHYFVLWKKNETDDRFLSLDVCDDYFRYSRFLLSSNELVTGRQRAIGRNGTPKTFYVPRPEMAFIYYFMKKVDKLSLTSDHGLYLSRLWGAAPTQALCQVMRFFGRASIPLIQHAAESGDWSEVQRHLVLIRRDLRRRMRRSSTAVWYAEAKRVLTRVRNPTGLHVVFLGADGSGKSTVIAQVLDRLKHAFRRTARIHLFPIGVSGATAGAIDPHGQPARGPLPSALQMGLWAWRYIGGWWLRVWPARVMSTAVLFDRYYHDLLVDPRRYRYGGSKWLARALGRLVPKPDLWILLDAPAETLQGRKQEVSVDESRRQRDAYLALAGSFDDAIIIDASASLDVVVRNVTRSVLEFMAQRTEARLGHISVPDRDVDARGADHGSGAARVH
jgi:thymidylate kinase